MVPCIFSEPSAAHFRPALDIQSLTAEIRQGNKKEEEERRKK